MSLSEVTRRSRARGAPQLAHWSEVDADHAQLSKRVVPILRDLVVWASDIAIAITRSTPEDREAVERCRYAALAWLDGHAPSEIATDDILTTAAAVLSNVERNLVRQETSRVLVDVDVVLHPGGAATVRINRAKADAR